ncbi:MAG: outer membrane protein assembly factor BamD [Deltaproteobacteria bacterium]|nr:outer membrane protein assembly factor BamD [Deltaproteobacteria bacterium]
MKKKGGFAVSIYYIVAFIFLVPLFASCRDQGFSLARTNKTLDECMTLLKKKKHDKAITCFEAYKSRHHGEKGSTEADLLVADAYFLKKDYIIAAEAYQTFIEANPYNEKTPYAYYKAGLSYLKETPKAIDRNQEHLDLAVQYLGTVVKYYTGTPYAAAAGESFNEARLKQARRHFYVGRYYYKAREYLAAIPRFQAIVTDYSKLGLDEKSFYYLVNALERTSQRELAQKYFDVFKTYYPDSKYAKRVKVMSRNLNVD